VRPSPERTDRGGQPLLPISRELEDNEVEMRAIMRVTAAATLDAGGSKYLNAFGDGSTPGLDHRARRLRAAGEYQGCVALETVGKTWAL
jgi:hypothetical protein